MDIASQMLMFATVVDHGSISAAARSLGQTPSAVSKQISLLENHVKHRLLNRVRTGVIPTQEGQEFYDRCKAMAAKFKEAQDLISQLDGNPRGNLKVASTVAFGKSQLIPALPKFLDQFPDVQVALDITDRNIDLQTEGYDAVVCFAEQAKDPDTISRRIMSSHRVLCAAPSYLARHGAPESFSDLSSHNCLRVSQGDGRNYWRNQNPSDTQDFEVQGRFQGNSTDVIFKATLAGMGIARLPSYLAEEKFKSGELVHVLEEYAPPSTEIVAMFADRRNLAPKTRAFIEFLVQEFGGRSVRAQS